MYTTDPKFHHKFLQVSNFLTNPPNTDLSPEKRCLTQYDKLNFRNCCSIRLTSPSAVSLPKVLQGLWVQSFLLCHLLMSVNERKPCPTGTSSVQSSPSQDSVRLSRKGLDPKAVLGLAFGQTTRNPAMILVPSDFLLGYTLAYFYMTITIHLP